MYLLHCLCLLILALLCNDICKQYSGLCSIGTILCQIMHARGNKLRESVKCCLNKQGRTLKLNTLAHVPLSIRDRLKVPTMLPLPISGDLMIKDAKVIQLPQTMLFFYRVVVCFCNNMSDSSTWPGWRVWRVRRRSCSRCSLGGVRWWTRNRTRRGGCPNGSWQKKLPGVATPNRFLFKTAR